jgi:hypothetical protein
VSLLLAIAIWFLINDHLMRGGGAEMPVRFADPPRTIPVMEP